MAELIKKSLICALLILTTTLAVAQEDEDREPPPRAYGPVVEQSDRLLEPPANLPNRDEFVIARTPPTITFSTMTGLPELTDKKRLGGLWTVWGEGVWASNGKCYVGVGDHRGENAKTYLYEYDPKTHEHRIVLDVWDYLGLRPGDWGHGKIHGRMDELPNGEIIFATYWGGHPDHLPPEEKLKIGGVLLGYNIHSGEVADYGIPYPGDSFPMHATDVRRGIFHGYGLGEAYLAYDLNQRKVLYAGKFPDDFSWSIRVTMIDPVTGICYGGEFNTRRIAGYNPKTNQFFHTKAQVPQHPYLDQEEKPWIRSYTRQRLDDGSLFAQSREGVMFKFFPDEERVEFVGINWHEGLYSTSVAMSSDKRFVYYTVGGHGSTWEVGSPVIQLDLHTYQKKVLAFLHPYFQEKHGYVCGGSYSVNIDEKGENLLITWNGRFREAKETGESFGHPSFMHVTIPASER